MATFYTGVDKERYDAGNKFLPMDQFLLNYKTPTTNTEEEVTESFGIPAAYNTSGGGSGVGGNAFGYGSKIKPGGSYGSYGTINYTGGLPGDVQQYGVGRQFEDPSASPIGETYSYKKTVPGWARFGAGFVPFGNTALNFIEDKMNTNRDQPPGTYKIGGLNESMKGLYDNLAGEGMLFEGPGGIKTLTGKNFAGKGYLEGQIELAKGFNFDTMTDEEIEADIAKTAANKKKQFEYKQKIEAWNVYKTNKAKEKNIEKMADLAAAESRRESARQYDPNVHGSTNYGLGKDGQQSYSGDALGDKDQGIGWSATGSGPVSNKSGKGRTDWADGGRIYLNYGGLASIL